MTLTVHFLSIGNRDWTVVEPPSARPTARDINRVPQDLGPPQRLFADQITFLPTELPRLGGHLVYSDHPDMEGENV